MKPIASIFCCGCLSSDRKLKPLTQYWIEEFYPKIVDELPLQMEEFSLQLCWECEARVSSLIKFKHQLKTCCRILWDYIKQPQKPYPISISRLAISKHELSNSGIDIAEINDESNLKYDEPYSPQLEVKVEMETVSDDDRTLMDIILTDGKEKSIPKEEGNLKKEEKIVKTEKNVRKERKVDKKRGFSKQKKVKLKRKHAQQLMFEQIELTHEEILQERVLSASKEDFVNAMFKCDSCILPFANEDDLKEHLEKKHSLTSNHKCEICKMSFSNNSSLTAHYKRHSVRYRCTVCRCASAAAGAALAHYTHKHMTPQGEIHDLAAKAFGTFEDKLEEKAVRPKSTEQIPCTYCDKTFRWKTSLRKHMETHSIASGHKRKPYCEPCNLTFATSSNLKKHMQDSSKHQIQLKLRKLKEAPSDASDAAHQVQDIESIKSSVISQKEQYPCPQCEKKFQWKGNLWRHLQSHAARATGSLVCEPCNRTFSSIATYKQHMEISKKHVTENDFKYMCSECGKRFYSKIKLRDHIDWHHLNKYTHTCTECHKVFKSHTSLYLHKQVVHKMNNASHLCDHCGKSFPNRTKLRSHVSGIHTKESPYKCASCSAKFSWHSCLSRHMRRVHKFKPTPG